MSPATIRAIVLKTPWIEPAKKERAWFGAVQLKKNYVSFHLIQALG